MNYTQVQNKKEEWLKVLGKGMVTLPKKWREELGIAAGDIVRAKREGNTVVLEPQEMRTAPYRVYSNAEIDEFLQEDKLSDDISKKVQDNLVSST